MTAIAKHVTVSRTTANIEPLAGSASSRVAILGYGTMGRAIATGLIRSGALDSNQIVVTARRTAALEAAGVELGVRTTSDNAAAAADADVIILCVKPKDAGSVLCELTRGEKPGDAPLLISIVAGLPIARIEESTNPRIPVLRAVPNTPCRIGRGLTVVASGRYATDAHRATASALFGCIGDCVTMEERHFDAVTALSASGAAFLYVMLEALADGGVMCGLSRAAATDIAARMALGSSALLLESGLHPAALREEVTTPAGCTAAGLLVLEDGRIRSVLARAIQSTAAAAGNLR